MIRYPDRHIFREMHDPVPEFLLDQIGRWHIGPFTESKIVRFEYASHYPKIREW